MKLYGSPTSPYVRKARVLISEKKLQCEFVVEDPWPEDSKIPTRNPLGKVPALDIDPSNYLFESVLIVHYLDHVDGHSLTPFDPAGYWQSQWWQALGNGIIDAAIARILESRRPAEKQMPEKTAREEARIHRATAVGGGQFQGRRVSRRQALHARRSDHGRGAAIRRFPLSARLARNARSSRCGTRGSSRASRSRKRCRRASPPLWAQLRANHVPDAVARCRKRRV